MSMDQGADLQGRPFDLDVPDTAGAGLDFIWLYGVGPIRAVPTGWDLAGTAYHQARLGGIPMVKILNLRVMAVFTLAFLLTSGVSIPGHAQGAPEPEELSPHVTSDIFPPILTIVSPAKDEVVNTGTPTIELTYEDLGSGIDEDTIQLSVDRANVTLQAAISPGRISYRPVVPLARGTHEVYFSVRDKAGNLAEVGWTFYVRPFFEGLQSGGRNTLRIEWYPVSKVKNTLDFALQTRIMDSDIRLHLLVHGTDYPDGTPLLNYDKYNAYLDRYSLEFRHGSTVAAAGYTTVPIESEIFQVSREVQGGVVNTSIGTPSGRHDLSAFYGKIASSSGLGLSVYDIAGITEQWKSKTGLVLQGICATLGGDDGYYLLGTGGRLRIAEKANLRFEVVHGRLKAQPASGNAFALHLDVPFSRCSLGMDAIMLQPEYPLPGTPSSLSPERGGVLRYGARAMVKVPEKGVLTVNGVLTRDNLDGSVAYTLSRGNLGADYYYPLPGGWNLRAGYQGEFKQSDDSPGPTVDSTSGVTSFTLSGQIGKPASRSSVQASYSTGLSDDHVTGKSARTAKLSGSWSMPLGSWSLSSTLDLARQEALDQASRTDSSSVRIAASGQVIPRLLQGTFSVFRTRSDKLEENSAGPTVCKTETGLETTLCANIHKALALSLVFKNSWWTQEDSTFREGQNRTLNLEWTAVF